MTSNVAKQLCSSLLAVTVLLTNTVMAYSVEVNFWAERQNKVRRSNDEVRTNTRLRTSEQLASLGLSPSTISLPQSNQLIKPSSEFFPRSSKFVLLKNLLPAFPSTYGSIRKIIPGKSDQTIIHIQDIHMNDEAQKNIGLTIKQLIKNKKIDLVALEGAFQPIDYSRYKKLNDSKAVNLVANYLLKTHKISGAVHTAFTDKNQTTPFIGIDDQVLYEKNVDAVIQSENIRSVEKEKLIELINKNSNEIKKLINQPLRDFHEAVIEYRNGIINLGEYFNKISAHFSDLPKSSKSFYEAYQLEKTLNLQRIETERSWFLNDLIKKLSDYDKQYLTSISLAFRNKEIPHTSFYRLLRNLCERNNFSLDRYKNMNNYIRYVLLSEDIDAEELFKEIRILEKSVFDKLTKDHKAKTLIEESRKLYLTGKLLDFALTKDEWDEFKEIRRTNDELRNNFALSTSEFVRFYEVAEARDIAMVQNLHKAIEKTKAKTIVLVTGGFHSKGIKNELLRQGDKETAGQGVVTRSPGPLVSSSLSIIEYVPNISKVTSKKDSEYLGIFTQEKTPLDRIFAGEKLFLPPPVSVPTSAYPYLDELVAATGATSREQAHQNLRRINPNISDENLPTKLINNVGEKIVRFKNHVWNLSLEQSGEIKSVFVKGVVEEFKVRPWLPLFGWLIYGNLSPPSWIIIDLAFNITYAILFSTVLHPKIRKGDNSEPEFYSLFSKERGFLLLLGLSVGVIGIILPSTLSQFIPLEFTFPYLQPAVIAATTFAQGLSHGIYNAAAFFLNLPLGLMTTPSGSSNGYSQEINDIIEFWKEGVFDDEQRRPFDSISTDIGVRENGQLDLPRSFRHRSDSYLFGMDSLTFKRGTTAKMSSDFIRNTPYGKNGHWFLRLDGIDESGTHKTQYIGFQKKAKQSRITILADFSLQAHINQFLRDSRNPLDSNRDPLGGKIFPIQVNNNTLNFGTYKNEDGFEFEAIRNSNQFLEGETMFVESLFKKDMPGKRPPQWIIRISGKFADGKVGERYYWFDMTPKGKSSKKVLKEIKFDLVESIHDFIYSPENFTNKNHPPFSESSFKTRIIDHGIFLGTLKNKNGIYQEVEANFKNRLEVGSEAIVTTEFVSDLPGNHPPQWILHVTGKKKKKDPDEETELETLSFRFTESEVVFEKIDLSPQGFAREFLKNEANRFDERTPPFPHPYFDHHLDGDSIQLYGFARIRAKTFALNKTVRVSPHFLRDPPLGLKPQWVIRVVGENKQGQIDEKYYQFPDSGDLKGIDLSPGGYIKSIANNKVDITTPKQRLFHEPSFSVPAQGKKINIGVFYRDREKHAVSMNHDKFIHRKNYTISPVYIDHRLSGYPSQWMLRVEWPNQQNEVEQLYFRFTQDGTFMEEVELKLDHNKNKQRNQLVDFALRGRKSWTNPYETPMDGLTFDGEVKFGKVLLKNYKLPGMDHGVPAHAFVAKNFSDGTKVKVSIDFQRHLPYGFPDQWLLRLVGKNKETGRLSEEFFQFRQTGGLLTPIEFTPETLIADLVDNLNHQSNPSRTPMRLPSFKSVSNGHYVLIGHLPPIENLTEGRTLALNTGKFPNGTPVIISPQFIPDLPGHHQGKWLFIISGIAEDSNHNKKLEEAHIYIGKNQLNPNKIGTHNLRISPEAYFSGFRSEFDRRLDPSDRALAGKGFLSSLDKQNLTFETFEFNQNTDVNHHLRIKLINYKNNSPIAVSSFFATDLPRNQEDQWTVRIIGIDKNSGELEERLLRFTKATGGYKQVEQSPKDYMADHFGDIDKTYNQHDRPIPTQSFPIDYKTQYFFGFARPLDHPEFNVSVRSNELKNHSPVTVVPFFLRDPPAGRNPQWVYRFEGLGPRDDNFTTVTRAYDSKEKKFLNLNLTASDYLSEFVKNPHNYKNKYVPPIREPYFDVKKTGTSIRLAEFRIAPNISNWIDFGGHAFPIGSTLRINPVFIENHPSGLEDQWLLRIIGKDRDGDISEEYYRFDENHSTRLKFVDLKNLAEEKQIAIEDEDQKLRKKIETPEVREIIKWLSEGVKTRKSKPPFTGVSFEYKTKRDQKTITLADISRAGQKFQLLNKFNEFGNSDSVNISAAYLKNLPGGLPEQWGLRYNVISESGKITSLVFRFGKHTKNGMHILIPVDYTHRGYLNEYVRKTTDFSYFQEDPFQGKTFKIKADRRDLGLGETKDKNGVKRHGQLRLPFKIGSHIHLSSAYRDDLPSGNPPQWLIRISGITDDGSPKEIFVKARDESSYLETIEFTYKEQLIDFTKNPSNFTNPNVTPFVSPHERIEIPKSDARRKVSDEMTLFGWRDQDDKYHNGSISKSRFEPGSQAILTYSFEQNLPHKLPSQWILKISGIKKKTNVSDKTELISVFYRFVEGTSLLEYVEMEPGSLITQFSKDPKNFSDPLHRPFQEPYFDIPIIDNQIRLGGYAYITVRKFDDSHPVRISAEFMENLPHGMEPQWIIRALGKGKNGQPIEKFMHFHSGEGYKLRSLDLSPSGYLSKYALNPIHDKNNPPFPHNSFRARTNIEDAELFFGHRKETEKREPVIAQSNRFSTDTEYLVSTVFLEERQTGIRDQWFVRVEGKTDNNEVETIYFRYTDSGTYLEEVEFPKEEGIEQKLGELGRFATHGPYTNRGDLPLNGISIEAKAIRNGFKLPNWPHFIHGGTKLFQPGTKIRLTPTFKTNLPRNKPDQWVLRVIGISTEGKIEEGFFEFMSEGIHLKNSDLTGAAHINALIEDPSMIYEINQRPLIEPSIHITVTGEETRIRESEFVKRASTTRPITLKTREFVPGSKLIVQPYFHNNPADGGPPQWVLKVAGLSRQDSGHKGFVIEKYFRIVPGKKSPVALNIDENSSLSVFAARDEDQLNPNHRPINGRSINEKLSLSGSYSIRPFFADRAGDFPGKEILLHGFRPSSQISVDTFHATSLPQGKPNKNLIRAIGIGNDGAVKIRYTELAKNSERTLNIVHMNTRAHLGTFFSHRPNTFDPSVSPLPSGSARISFAESGLFLTPLVPSINLPQFKPNQTLIIKPEFRTSGMPYGIQNQWIFVIEGENTAGDFVMTKVYFDQESGTLHQLDLSQKAHIMAFAKDPNNYDDPYSIPFPSYDVEWEVSKAGVNFGSWKTNKGQKSVRMAVEKTYGVGSKVLVSAHFLRNHPSGVKNQWIFRVAGVVDGNIVEKFYHFTKKLNVLRPIDLSIPEETDNTTLPLEKDKTPLSDHIATDKDLEETIDDFLDEAEKEFDKSREEEVTAQDIYQRMLSKGWDAVAKDYSNQRENLAPFWQSLYIYSWIIFHFPIETVQFIFKSVLITAAGPLGVTFPLLRRQLEAKGTKFPRVVELDISQKMLEEAIRKDEEKGFPQPIRIRGNMARMPFQNQNGHLTLKEGTPVVSNDSPDIKINKFSFVHLGSLSLLSAKLRGRAIVEANRVMEVGGYSVISTNNKEFSPSFLESVEKLGFELITEDPVRIQYTDAQRILLRSTGVPEEAVKKITKKVNKLKGHFIVIRKVKSLTPEEAAIYRILDFSLEGYRWMTPEGTREDVPLIDDFDLTTLDYQKIPPSLFLDRSLEKELWKRIDKFLGSSHSHSDNEIKAYVRARDMAKERMRNFLEFVRESDTEQISEKLKDPEFREQRLEIWRNHNIPPANEKYSINGGAEEFVLNKDDYMNLLHVWDIFLNELADAIIAKHDLNSVRIPLEYYDGVPNDDNSSIPPNQHQEKLDEYLDILEAKINGTGYEYHDIPIWKSLNKTTRDMNEDSWKSFEFYMDNESEKVDFNSLITLAHYILDKGPKNFSEAQLRRIEEIIELMKQKKLVSTSISLPLIFILSLSTFFKGKRKEHAFVRLSKRFKDLPGSFADRTIALNLLLKSRHLAKGILLEDWSDIEIVSSHIQYAKKRLKHKNIDPELKRNLQIGLGYFLLSSKVSFDPHDDVKTWLWFGTSSFRQEFPHPPETNVETEYLDHAKNQWDRVQSLFQKSISAHYRSKWKYDPVILEAANVAAEKAKEDGKESLLRRAWIYQLPFYFALSQYDPNALQTLEERLFNNTNQFQRPIFSQFEDWIIITRGHKLSSEFLDENYTYPNNVHRAPDFNSLIFRLDQEKQHNFDNATYWATWRGFGLGAFVNGALAFSTYPIFGFTEPFWIIFIGLFVAGGFLSLAGFGALADQYGDQIIATRHQDGSVSHHSFFHLNSNKSFFSQLGHVMVDVHELSPWHNIGMILMVLMPIVLPIILFIRIFNNLTLAPALNIANRQRSQDESSKPSPAFFATPTDGTNKGSDGGLILRIADLRRNLIHSANQSLNIMTEIVLGIKTDYSLNDFLLPEYHRQLILRTLSSNQVSNSQLLDFSPSLEAVYFVYLLEDNEERLKVPEPLKKGDFKDLRPFLRSQESRFLFDHMMENPDKFEIPSIESDKKIFSVLLSIHYLGRKWTSTNGGNLSNELQHALSRIEEAINQHLEQLSLADKYRPKVISPPDLIAILTREEKHKAAKLLEQFEISRLHSIGALIEFSVNLDLDENEEALEDIRNTIQSMISKEYQFTSSLNTFRKYFLPKNLITIQEVRNIIYSSDHSEDAEIMEILPDLYKPIQINKFAVRSVLRRNNRFLQSLPRIKSILDSLMTRNRKLHFALFRFYMDVLAEMSWIPPNSLARSTGKQVSVASFKKDLSPTSQVVFHLLQSGDKPEPNYLIKKHRKAGAIGLSEQDYEVALDEIYAKLNSIGAPNLHSKLATLKKKIDKQRGSHNFDYATTWAGWPGFVLGGIVNSLLSLTIYPLFQDPITFWIVFVSIFVAAGFLSLAGFGSLAHQYGDSVVATRNADGIVFYHPLFFINSPKSFASRLGHSMVKIHETSPWHNLGMVLMVMALPLLIITALPLPSLSPQFASSPKIRSNTHDPLTKFLFTEGRNPKKRESSPKFYHGFSSPVKVSQLRPYIGEAAGKDLSKMSDLVLGNGSPRKNPGDFTPRRDSIKEIRAAVQELETGKEKIRDLSPTLESVYFVYLVHPNDSLLDLKITGQPIKAADNISALLRSEHSRSLLQKILKNPHDFHIPNFVSEPKSLATALTLIHLIRKWEAHNKRSIPQNFNHGLTRLERRVHRFLNPRRGRKRPSSTPALNYTVLLATLKKNRLIASAELAERIMIAIGKEQIDMFRLSVILEGEDNAVLYQEIINVINQLEDKRYVLNDVIKTLKNRFIKPNLLTLKGLSEFLDTPRHKRKFEALREIVTWTIENRGDTSNTIIRLKSFPINLSEVRDLANLLDSYPKHGRPLGYAANYINRKVLKPYIESFERKNNKQHNFENATYWANWTGFLLGGLVNGFLSIVVYPMIQDPVAFWIIFITLFVAGGLLSLTGFGALADQYGNEIIATRHQDGSVSHHPLFYHNSNRSFSSRIGHTMVNVHELSPGHNFGMILMVILFPVLILMLLTPPSFAFYQSFFPQGLTNSLNDSLNSSRDNFAFMNGKVGGPIQRKNQPGHIRVVEVRYGINSETNKSLSIMANTVLGKQGRYNLHDFVLPEEHRETIRQKLSAIRIINGVVRDFSPTLEAIYFTYLMGSSDIPSEINNKEKGIEFNDLRPLLLSSRTREFLDQMQSNPQNFEIPVKLGMEKRDFSTVVSIRYLGERLGKANGGIIAEDLRIALNRLKVSIDSHIGGQEKVVTPRSQNLNPQELGDYFRKTGQHQAAILIETAENFRSGSRGDFFAFTLAYDLEENRETLNVIRDTLKDFESQGYRMTTSVRTFRLLFLEENLILVNELTDAIIDSDNRGDIRLVEHLLDRYKNKWININKIREDLLGNKGFLRGLIRIKGILDKLTTEGRHLSYPLHRIYTDLLTDTNLIPELEPVKGKTRHKSIGYFKKKLSPNGQIVLHLLQSGEKPDPDILREQHSIKGDLTLSWLDYKEAISEIDNVLSSAHPQELHSKLTTIKRAIDKQKGGHNFDNARYWDSWRGFLLGSVVNSILSLPFFIGFDFTNLSFILLVGIFITSGFLSLAGFAALADIYGNDIVATRLEDGTILKPNDFDFNSQQSVFSQLGHTMVDIHERFSSHKMGMIVMVAFIPLQFVYSMVSKLPILKQTNGPTINGPSTFRSTSYSMTLIIASIAIVTLFFSIFELDLTPLIPLVLIYVLFTQVQFHLVHKMIQHGKDDTKPDYLISHFKKPLTEYEPIDFEDPFWIEQFMELGIPDNRELFSSLFVSIRGDLVPTINLSRSPPLLQWIYFIFFFPDWHNWLASHFKKINPYHFQPLPYYLTYIFSLFSQSVLPIVGNKFIPIYVILFGPILVLLFSLIVNYVYRNHLLLRPGIDLPHVDEKLTPERHKEFSKAIRKVRKNKFMRTMLKYFMRNSNVTGIDALLSTARDQKFLGGRGYRIKWRNEDFMDGFEHAFIWINNKSDSKSDYRTSAHELIELFLIQYLLKNTDLTWTDFQTLESHDNEFIEIYGTWLELQFADELGYDLETKDQIAHSFVESMRTAHLRRTINNEALENNPSPILDMYNAHMDAYENSFAMQTTIPLAFMESNPDGREERVDAVLEFINRANHASSNLFENHIRTVSQTKSILPNWLRRTGAAIALSLSLISSEGNAFSLAQPASVNRPFNQLVDNHRQEILNLTSSNAIQSMGYSQVGNRLTFNQQNRLTKSIIAGIKPAPLKKSFDLKRISLLRRQS